MTETNDQLPKPEKHWMLGSKSFIDVEPVDFRIGTEPIIDDYLTGVIVNTQVVKHMLPRFYRAISRDGSTYYIPFFYDPMIEVSDNRVTFTMRDRNDNLDWQKVWQLEFNERVFTPDSIKQAGKIFIDFNQDFIKSLQLLKKSVTACLSINNTGLDYSDDTDTHHLPDESRDTLIKLLTLANNMMITKPDDQLSVKTELAWNQSLHIPTGESFYRRGRRTRREWSANRQQFITTSIREDFPSLFDSNAGRGEVYNPFYSFANRQSHAKSRSARYFADEIIVKHFSEDNDYIIELPLTDLKNEPLGHVKMLGKGRTELEFES